jgi:hypothetical protein
MALSKYSAFYYGHTINRANQYLNFRDSGLVAPAQYAATLSIGSFTITQFGNIVAQAMNAVGAQEYTVSLDRATRKFTISADNNFELLISSGNNASISIFNLLGFNGSDLSGSNSYTADSVSGEAYITQTPLKNLSDFINNKEKAEAAVKTTPNGIVEVVSYSVLERLKCDLPLITNYTPQRYIRETATGIEEARAFMDYAIDKAPLEFVYDYQNPDNFVPCILDKTKTSPKGVGYELREKVTASLPGYYELTGLQFLKIEDR